MVVRTDGAQGSAFLFPRPWHNGVTRAVRALTAFPTAERALANARSSALLLSGERLYREATDRLLAPHAETRSRPAA